MECAMDANAVTKAWRCLLEDDLCNFLLATLNSKPVLKSKLYKGMGHYQNFISGPWLRPEQSLIYTKLQNCRFVHFSWPAFLVVYGAGLSTSG